MADSTTLTRQLADAQQRAEQLRERLTELDAEIETKRGDLGKAMALGDSDTKLKSIRKSIRDAEDEKEGAERGLVFLAEETERLEGDLASAKAAEAAADRDAKVAEAVAAIDQMAAALNAWLEEAFLPLVDSARSLSVRAVDAEKRAATLAGVRLPSTSRTYREGWAMHLGLEGVMGALRRYAEESAALATDAKRGKEKRPA